MCLKSSGMRVLANSSSSRTTNESPLSDQRISSTFFSSSRKLEGGRGQLGAFRESGQTGCLPAEFLHKGRDLFALDGGILLGLERELLKSLDALLFRHCRAVCLLWGEECRRRRRIVFYKGPRIVGGVKVCTRGRGDKGPVLLSSCQHVVWCCSRRRSVVMLLRLLLLRLYLRLLVLCGHHAVRIHGLRNTGNKGRVVRTVMPPHEIVVAGRAPISMLHLGHWYRRRRARCRTFPRVRRHGLRIHRGCFESPPCRERPGLRSRRRCGVERGSLVIVGQPDVGLSRVWRTEEEMSSTVARSRGCLESRATPDESEEEREASSGAMGSVGVLYAGLRGSEPGRARVFPYMFSSLCKSFTVFRSPSITPPKRLIQKRRGRVRDASRMSRAKPSCPMSRRSHSRSLSTGDQRTWTRAA